MEPKEGDIFVSILDGATFLIQKIGNEMVLLKSKDGKREILTGLSNLNSLYREEGGIKIEKGVERRRNPRYLVKGDLIASLYNRKEKEGKVEDISMGGLSFEHVPPVNEKRSNQESPVGNLSLRMGDDFSLSEVSCRIIYDTPVQVIQSSKYRKFPVDSKARRCGVQFQMFSDDQNRQLELFLKTNTLGILASAL